jgi:hypothetical protein
MTLVEFNEMDFLERHRYLFGGKDVGFKCFREDDEYKYSLWDCGSFYAEMQLRKSDRKVTMVDGIGLNDERINFYLDWINEHKDDDFPE